MDYSTLSSHFIINFVRMLIGQLSKELNISKDTIRFYETQGLIHPKPSSSMYNNYKEYTETEVQQLRFIKKAKSYGFTLKEIAESLQEMKEQKADCASLKNKALNKIIKLDKKIAELQTWKSNILEEFKHAKPICSTVQKNANCARLATFFDN